MDQEKQFWPRFGKCRLQRLRLKHKWSARVTELHWDGERIAGLLQVISKYSVERGKYGILLGSARYGVTWSEKLCEGGKGAVNPGSYKTRYTTNGSVNHTIDRAHGALKRLSQDEGAASDRLMHGFDKIADAQSRLDGETACAAQMIDVRAKAASSLPRLRLG
jgi:hypothetical protein